MENSRLENCTPSKTGKTRYINKTKWSCTKFPVNANRERVISIPKVKTAFREGLNSLPLVPLYKIATGGPPIAAIIPNIPEKVPARSEFIEFLFTFQPKYEPSPALSTITPTEIDSKFGSNVVRNSKPIGPPITLPPIRNFMGFQLTFDFSLIKSLNAKGRPKRESSWGTKAGSIWTIIGDAMTAKPNPRTPWTDEEINNNSAIKNSSKIERSKGMFN